MKSMFREKTALALKELSQVFERMEESDLRPLLEAIKKAGRVFLIGAGREGLATKSFAMRLMHLGKQAHWVWDDTAPGMGPGDLLLMPCGSGEIGHLSYIAMRAKENGAQLAVLSPSNAGSCIEQADIYLHVPAAAYNAKGSFVLSQQPMGNLFEHTLFILYDVLIMMLMEEMHVSAAQMEKRHRNVE